MIKYRVWDNTEQKYDYDGYSIGCDGKLYKSGGVVELAKDYIIEQYTGLKDKNGAEIAVGDIVAGSGDKGEVVVMRYGAFEPVSYYQDEIMTIIGNIHENTEFLEEK